MMTSRERLNNVIRRKPTDRLPIKLWGVDPMFPRTDWKPIYELMEKYHVDIVRAWQPTGETYRRGVEHILPDRKSDKQEMWERTSVLETPLGQLKQTYYIPKDSSPGYVKKHYVETVEDAKKWLSIKKVPDLPGNVDPYFELERKTGNSAMLMIHLPEAMYSIQDMMGSTTFSFWLMEHRELLHEMINVAFRDIEALVKKYLSYGIGDCYGWVGPELCLPPLASPDDFQEFVFEYDRKIIDLIHNAGKITWIHSHGDMKPVLEKFIEMGLDCLNPIEPPPVGSYTLEQAKKIVNGRMTLEGNVEDGAFDLLKPKQIEELTEDCIRQGKPGGCFILCPTSSPTTWPVLEEKHALNYKAFVETWARFADY